MPIANAKTPDKGLNKFTPQQFHSGLHLTPGSFTIKTH